MLPKALFNITGLLAVFTAALPGQKPSIEARATQCTATKLNTLLFSTSLSDFQKDRNAKSPSCFDWSSDECSNAPDSIPGLLNFKPSCERHDFGYQNSHVLGTWNAAMKKRIDDNFLKDLLKYCEDLPWYKKLATIDCAGLAGTYYAAVRACGGVDHVYCPKT